MKEIVNSPVHFFYPALIFILVFSYRSFPISLTINRDVAHLHATVNEQSESALPLIVQSFFLHQPLFKHTQFLKVKKNSGKRMTPCLPVHGWHQMLKVGLMNMPDGLRQSDAHIRRRSWLYPIHWFG